MVEGLLVYNGFNDSLKDVSDMHVMWKTIRMLFDIKEMSGYRALCPLTQHSTYVVQSVMFQEWMSDFTAYD